MPEVFKYEPYRLKRMVDGDWTRYHIETNSQMVLRVLTDGTLSGTVESALTKVENDIATVQGKVTNLQTALGDKADAVESPGNGGLVEVTPEGKLQNAGKSIGDLANAAHKHSATDIDDGILPVLHGGTGVTSYSSLRSKLGLGTGTGVLGLSYGGTGANTAAGAREALGFTLENLGLTVTADEINMLGGIADNVQEQIDGFATTYVQTTSKGAAGGIAPLDEDGKISAQYLPSYVDDVIDGTFVSNTVFNDKDGNALTGEVGKIYVDVNTNKTYRWSGTVFVAVGGGGVELGTTSATAFRGDYGQEAWEHAKAAHARTDATAVSYVSNGVLKLNDVNTTVYTHPTYEVSNASGSSDVTDGALTAITDIEESNGHITKITKTSFTLPAGGGTSEVVSASQPTGQKAGDYWNQPIS